MTPEKIIEEARRRGLQLERRGDLLVVKPRNLITEDLRSAFRQHKQELIGLLSTRSEPLSPDCAPWLHVARQILSGEFDGTDRSTVKSLATGLRSVGHPVCRRALDHLQQRSQP